MTVANDSRRGSQLTTITGPTVESRGAHAKHIYLDETTAARYLGFSDSSRRLKDLRQAGGGPRYVRIGSAVRYRSDWLDAWAEANAVSSTSEEAARRRE
jgi:hypothetical protein